MHDEATRKYLQSVKRLGPSRRGSGGRPEAARASTRRYNGSDKEALVEQEEKRRRGEEGGEGDPLLALPSAGEGDDRRGDGGRSTAAPVASAGNVRPEKPRTRAYDGEEAAGGGRTCCEGRRAREGQDDVRRQERASQVGRAASDDEGGGERMRTENEDWFV